MTTSVPTTPNVTPVVLGRVEPGLDLAAEGLAVGRGWLTADIQADQSNPLTVKVEAGKKISDSTSIFGDVWTQPFAKTAGADLGIRNGNLDIFAGAYGGLDGSWGATAGVKLSF